MMTKTRRSEFIQVCQREAEQVEWDKYPIVIFDDILKRLSSLVACSDEAITLWITKTEKDCGKLMATNVF